MAFFGTRATGDWQTDQRPKSWREMILYLYPNGMAPLTAILSKMPSEQVDDPEFYWWTQVMPNQGGAFSSSTGLNGGTKGDIAKITAAQDVIQYFREGHQVAARTADGDPSNDTLGKVVEAVRNGASSYIRVQLLQDDQSGGTFSANDRILVVGNINPEHGPMPDPIALDPTKWYNYTQIFRTPLSISRTAQKTRLRTGEQYQKAKREALEIHSLEMEKAFLWGVMNETTGSNGKPERTTTGVLNAIRGVGAGHGGDGGVVDRFPDTYSGSTWLDKGEEWLDAQLEELFRYGEREKLALCGSGALSGINRLVKNGGQFEFTPDTAGYGLKVTRWVTPFGEINLMTHPMLSHEPSTRNTMILLEPANMNYRYIDDTTFYEEGEQQNTGRNRVDGRDEEYLTEAGLEYHNPISWGLLSGVGKDG